jgi:hypothetical protein
VFPVCTTFKKCLPLTSSRNDKFGKSIFALFSSTFRIQNNDHKIVVRQWGLEIAHNRKKIKNLEI